MRETDEGGGRGRKHCFINFCSLALLYLAVGEGLWDRTSYLGPAEISSFSSRDLSWRDNHDSFWFVLSTRYFYILSLWAVAVSDFLLVEIHKHLIHPLSSITFTADSQADSNLYEYIYLFQILYSMKSDRYTLRFFIFKFD